MREGRKVEIAVGGRQGLAAIEFQAPADFDLANQIPPPSDNAQ